MATETDKMAAAILIAAPLPPEQRFSDIAGPETARSTAGPRAAAFDLEILAALHSPPR
ncbi:MAG TPA: hypothetical protein VND95_01255 [Stellaceae bacterium]|nr:hypothetical protein [Stellaceae bacterium]